MRIGILSSALTMSLAAACGSSDPPESIRYGARPPTAGPGAAGATGGQSRDAGIEVGTYTEELVEADPAPLPIAGGTLAIIAKGTKAALSDPDRDQVVVIDLASVKVIQAIALKLGDDPGRLIEDGAGRLHVALRAGRGVAVLDPTSGATLDRIPVCPLPRGLAYESSSDSVHVACAGGELVSYTASGGEFTRKLRLERDLRDVVVDGERLLVSRFRAAELLIVQREGTVSGKLVPPVVGGTGGGDGGFSGGKGGIIAGGGIMKPAVAWRAVAAPGGGALMVYQLVSTGSIGTEGGGYGAQCRRIVTTAVSLLRVEGGVWTAIGIPTVLPVDVASTSDGARVAVPGAGRSSPYDVSVNFSLQTMPFVVFNAPNTPHAIISGCGSSTIGMPPFVDGTPVPTGRVVAVAFDPAGRLALQTREPGMFHLGNRYLVLPGRHRKHTGHELFHLATVGGIACASCHPEGTEDGQVWDFAGLGKRRTQSLAGGILGTEPFHWSGDMRDFNMIAMDVFSQRMSGPNVEPMHRISLMNWVNTIPSREPPAAADPGAVERGKAIFNDSFVGCASCHSGPRMTNNANADVNTAGHFQVPSLLGLAWRAPYMHEGCAATLADRFAPCGGGDSHGKTSQLTPAERSDLIAYMDSL
jgi:hypothetical protein